MKTIKSNISTSTTQTFWSQTKCAFVVLGMSMTTHAQQPNEYQNKYPGQSEVVTEYVEHYYIQLDKNNQLKISQDNIEETMILTDKGTGFSAVESIVFSDLNSIKSYEAYTLNTIDKKEKKTPIARIVDKKLDQESVFDSDVKLKLFNYANLTLGSKKVLKYTVDFKDPYLLHRFMFATGTPHVQRTLKISYPENIQLEYKMFNTNGLEIIENSDTKKGIKTLTFTHLNPEIIRNDNNAAGRMYEAPHLHFWVSEYTANQEKKEVLGTTDKLYAYYYNFIQQINQKENSALKTFTLDLIKDKTSDEEKLKTIFRWVQKNIKYVAFESGYEGFIPREAGLVFERKYGDCKDMTSIITEMAKYAQVPNVNFTWIGTREIPYTYKELPTPAVDNHMIATYISGDQIIYLDATDENVPFGLPSNFIQGKEALIAQNKSYKLATVPEISAGINQRKDIIDIQLDQQKIIGKGVYTTEGLIATSLRNIIGDNQKKRKDFAFALLQKGNNKFKLNAFEEKNFDQNELPYSFDYSFELENYVVNAGKEIYVNLAMDKPLQNDSFEPTRKQTYDNDYLQKDVYQVSLQIPKNSKITYVPKDVFFENDLLKYSFVYKILQDKVVLDYQIETKKILIKPSEFSLWNETIKKLKENYLETIIITRS